MITVDQVIKGRGQVVSSLYLVKKGDEVIGQLEKYNDSKGIAHPWRAYLGNSHERRYLSSFYDAKCGGDGKRAAVQRIVEAYQRAIIN